MPTAPWQGYDRMMLPVTFDADGNAIGTTGGSIAITPYRVKVTLEAPAEPLWNEFFKDVEIFVEQESSVLSGADRAGLAALKSMRSALWPRRHDRMKPSAAMATVAGAGPKSTADVRRNVSDIDAWTGTPGTRSDNRPKAMARPGNSIHSAGRGIVSRLVSDCAIVNSPSAVTAAT